MQKSPRSRTAGLATAALLALGAGTTVALTGALPAGAAPSDGLVINEVYGGGGNSGATYTQDFVEITNRGSSAISVDGYSVQYTSSSGTASWQTTPLSGSIAPGAFYLVAEAKGSGGSTALPTPDATGTIAMSATAGTVALVDSTTALTCHTSADCASAVVDLVGFGSAAIDEGSPAAGASNSESVQRSSAPDSDDNSQDFTAGDPTPAAANSGGDGGTGTGEPGPLRIHDIQGDSWISPHDGDAVTNVPGIVTGVRTQGSSKGFWFQDPDPDNDPATSEGLFAFTSSPTVKVGDSVLVSGTVQDYYPLSSGETLSTTSNLSTTELDSLTVIVLTHDQQVPAAERVTGADLPDAYAHDLGGGDIEKTSLDPSRSVLDFWESREGMRVEVDDVRVVGPSNAYGEQYVTLKPKENPSYRGGTELLAENQTPTGRLEIVPVDGSNPAVQVGDLINGATVGPVEWSSYGGYTIAATTLGTVQHNKLKPVVATPQSKKQLAIATYNVENLAPSDPASKFTALADGIVKNLSSPDIVALEEVQDNDGATDDGVVAADQTLKKLTSAIVAEGGPDYAWRSVDPVSDQDGGEPGGNIRNVFLYTTDRVSFTDRGGASTDRSTTGTTVTKVKGEPALTLSPGRIDPTNPVWASSRKPLVGQFSFKGKPVFVIANHFDAKLGDQNADGRYQYPEQSSQTQRAGQALVVHDFVQQILDVDKKADVVVVGDLNDYQFSPALSVLKTGSAAGTGTANLTDLITTLPVKQQYTYVYDGISEVLDHILVTKGADKNVEYQVVHINAEFTNQTSDHDPQVVRLNP
ncbi:endonuclease [Microlunatus endophyticus]|uniref:Endonuclease n=1 Tax=Microlunatus endophyticus TaxID=1716077 RepID=A0A917S676_9ACTN|nr:lamin tail domain-containing protein [Microlunatus endophyticus]GGL60864.1 endonuclease [Microlunatus endophyticus]